MAESVQISYTVQDMTISQHYRPLIAELCQIARHFSILNNDGRTVLWSIARHSRNVSERSDLLAILITALIHAL